MGTSLEKTRKKIAKKKGPIEAIHQGSRDSKRLGAAQARDEKLGKLALAKRRSDKPWSVFYHPSNSLCLRTGLTKLKLNVRDTSSKVLNGTEESRWSWMSFNSSLMG